MNDHTAENVFSNVVHNRYLTEDVRPMPDTRGNIAFARTEHSGELLDAHLLRPDPAFDRNHDKEHSARRELAQAMHQIASGLITVEEETPPTQADGWIILHSQIDILLCGAQEAWERGDRTGTQDLLGLALVRSVELAHIMGLDAVEIVDEENARILAKIAAKKEIPTHA